MYNQSVFRTTILFLATIFSVNLFANEPASSDQTIIITANRTEQNINDTLAAVDIFTREDIDRIQPESVTDLLATVAGFDLVYNGGAGQNSSLFTRGTSSDHTLVLIDGVRVGSATSGNKAFSSIPIAQIERIEIVKGPRASLWGSDAIGGVIQIFTRRLNDGEYSFSAKLGTDSYKDANFSLGFGSPDIQNTLTISYEDSDGFDALDDSSDFGDDSEPDNDGYQKLSAAMRGDYKLSPATYLDWVVQYDEGNNLYDNQWGANENDFNNHLWNIRYTYKFNKWLTEFSVKQNRDKSFSFDSRATEKNGSVFETRRNQVNVLTQYSLNDSVNLSTGIERYTDDIGRSQTLQFDGTYATFAEVERTSEAIFISGIVDVNRFIGEFSARYDDIEKVGSEQTFNLSAGYKIFDNFIISSSRSKGFKAPTFNDLYYPGFGNPDLISEISYNTEFIAKAFWENQSIELVKYDNNVDQLIAYNPNCFCSENIAKANLKGHELVYQLRHDSLTHKLSASYVDAMEKSLDSVTGLPKTEQLLRRAKEHYSYEIIADLGDFSFYSQFNYSGRRSDNDFSTFPSTSVYLKSYITVNLGAGYKATDQLTFRLKVSDFTEAAESTILNYNVPGRQLFLSFQFRNF